jgi:hypothetical protein
MGTERAQGNVKSRLRPVPEPDEPACAVSIG